MTVESPTFISRRFSLWWRRLGRTGGNCTRLWDTQWPVSADPVCMRERQPHNVWVERGRERSGAVDGPFSLVSCRSNESVGGVLPPSPRVPVNCLHLALQVTVDCRHLPRKREWGAWTAFASLTTGQCGSPYHSQRSAIVFSSYTITDRLQLTHKMCPNSSSTDVCRLQMSSLGIESSPSAAEVSSWSIVSICHTSVIVRYRLHLPHKCHREVSSSSPTQVSSWGIVFICHTSVIVRYRLHLPHHKSVPEEEWSGVCDCVTNVCTWNWSTGSWPSSLSAALVFGDASATCGLLSHCARCRRCGHVEVYGCLRSRQVAYQWSRRVFGEWLNRLQPKTF